MRARPAPTVQTVQLPAPVGGINTVAAGLSMPPTDCVAAYNLYGAENGLAVRLGEREWALGMTGETRTTISFLGASTSKIFVTAPEGIYDVTDSRDDVSELDPSFKPFPSTSGNAGYGVYTTFVTEAGHYLLYADEENGLYIYSEAGGTWTKVASGTGPGQISNLDPGKAAFVMAFKGRLWFAERDTASAWYLDVGQIAGAATEFPMGTRFRMGGTLVGLWDWTYDGGGGLDDALVALSSGGDVLVYKGTDPDFAETFGLQGVWYAGPPPAGRTIASNFGGELLLLTRQGLLPMSRLVVGIPDVRAEALTAKVSNLVNVLMTQRASSMGWQIIQHPETATLNILIPRGSGTEALQLVQSAGSKGWFLHRGLAMANAAVSSGQLFYCTAESPGRVCVNTGYVDGVTLDAPANFTPIDWSLQTAFSDFGTPRQKQMSMVRPLILSSGVTTFQTEARYQYDQSDMASVPWESSGASGTWDNALWDDGVWDGGSTSLAQVRGTVGLGTAMGIAIRGSSVTRSILVAFDITYTQGGFL